MTEFKVLSLDIINRAGFEFKVSSNSYDGYVIIIAKNDFLKYTAFKSFSSPKLAREWCDNLVNSTKAIYRDILDEK